MWAVWCTSLLKERGECGAVLSERGEAACKLDCVVPLVERVQRCGRVRQSLLRLLDGRCRAVVCHRYNAHTHSCRLASVDMATATLVSSMRRWRSSLQAKSDPSTHGRGVRDETWPTYQSIHHPPSTTLLPSYCSRSV